VAKKRGRQLDIEERRREVARMVRERIGYREIAVKLKVSKSTVGSDVQAILAEWRAEQVDNIERQRLIDLATIDEGIRPLLPKVRRGQLHATEVLLKLLARRAKMMGLDSPERHEWTGKDGGPIQTKSEIDISRLEPEDAQRLLELIEKASQ
jgi:hypothetical protein